MYCKMSDNVIFIDDFIEYITMSDIFYVEYNYLEISYRVISKWKREIFNRLIKGHNLVRPAIRPTSIDMPDFIDAILFIKMIMLYYDNVTIVRCNKMSFLTLIEYKNIVVDTVNMYVDKYEINHIISILSSRFNFIDSNYIDIIVTSTIKSISVINQTNK